jgi:hypothetical protein
LSDRLPNTGLSTGAPAPRRGSRLPIMPSILAVRARIHGLCRPCGHSSFVVPVDTPDGPSTHFTPRSVSSSLSLSLSFCATRPRVGGQKPPSWRDCTMSSLFFPCGLSLRPTPLPRRCCRSCCRRCCRRRWWRCYLSPLLRMKQRWKLEVLRAAVPSSALLNCLQPSLLFASSAAGGGEV